MSITVEDGMLALRGERHQRRSRRTRSSRWKASSAASGSFASGRDDTAAIKAESKDGVLTIHVPKTKVVL
jgi:HSP20 family molecular chaperone IbpA